MPTTPHSLQFHAVHRSGAAAWRRPARAHARTTIPYLSSPGQHSLQLYLPTIVSVHMDVQMLIYRGN
jgi:hypothetical protein